MQLTAMAPRSAAITQAWNPVQVQLDIAQKPDPYGSDLLVVTFRIPTAPSASVSQASGRVKTWRNGVVINEQTIEGIAHPRERAMAASVADALRGSRFLADSKVATGLEPLPVGHVRITTTEADGTRRSMTMSVNDTLAGYERVDTAIETYLDAIFDAA